MLIKNKVTGAIYPYTEYLFSTGKFEIYEPLLESEDVEETISSDASFLELFKTIPKSAATKDFVETWLETILTDRQYKTLIVRIYG